MVINFIDRRSERSLNPLSQISIITSLASYYNPLTRIGGVEYVAEVRLCHIAAPYADAYNYLCLSSCSLNVMTMSLDSVLASLPKS